jgi:soluble lytic murein transglycosylase-like protein
MRGQIQLRKMDSTPADFKPQVEALIQKYAAQNGLKPELVRAVIQQESSGNPHCVSVAGAVGLMQLMPSTARGLGVSDPFDPEQNVAGGTKYLAGLLREFDGDLPKSLAAYNAGPAAVRKHGGIPPFAETQNYVRRIMGMLEQR